MFTDPMVWTVVTMFFFGICLILQHMQIRSLNKRLGSTIEVGAKDKVSLSSQVSDIKILYAFLLIHSNRRIRRAWQRLVDEKKLPYLKEAEIALRHFNEKGELL